MSSSTCILEESSAVSPVEGAVVAVVDLTFSCTGVVSLVGAFRVSFGNVVSSCCALPRWRIGCDLECRRGVGSDVVEICVVWAHRAGVDRHLLM